MTSEEIDERIGALSAEREALAGKIAELRAQRPREMVLDYDLQDSEGNSIKLSELFGGKTDLIVIHNMGTRCSYCTLWADGFNGFTKHIESRAAFAVISPDPPSTQESFAASRGWMFRMASAEGTSFVADMGFEPTPGEVWPGVSTFKKNPDGGIVRVSRDYLGPGDVYCAVWHLFDLLADGVNHWEPKFAY